MDNFFQDPNEVRLPPEEVRLRDVQVTPQSNGRLVKINIELTPFMKRPNIEVTITAPSGKEAAHTSILETMLPKLEFTMHLREPEPGREYTVETKVYYQRMPTPTDVPMDLPIPDPIIVDHRQLKFILPQLAT